MITNTQRKTAQAIINIFETDKPLGDYARVTALPGDPGHLTYGRSQATLASGSLALLLHAYCEASGKYADALEPYLSAFDRCDLCLDNNEKVKSLLWLAGKDPVMATVQDRFFDRLYWEPSLKEAKTIGIELPLSATVVYDSKIHGSYYKIKAMTIDKYGTVDEIGEKDWIKNYICLRKEWLSNHRNTLIRKTVYRMDSLGELVEKKRWNLDLPLVVRSIVISEELFKEMDCWPIIASASDRRERVLLLTVPRMRGEDVKQLQRSLHLPREKIDGIFGPATDQAVRDFQEKNGLKIDGRVGPLTRAELGYN
jgi:chitosanase